MRSLRLLAIAFAISTAACSNSSPSPGSPPAPSPEAGPGADSGGSQGGASDSGCVLSGPAIHSAPAQWMAPADCGGIGNVCPNASGCGSQSECQLLGNMCIPSAGPDGFGEDCPQTPYCMASSCMTYAQASCFCTGEAGASVSACACGPEAVVGLCAAEGASCASTACCDCQGLKCMTDSVSGSVCRQPCTQNTDCATGCCDTSAGFCHDALYCNCADAGAGCGGSGPSCCPGSECLTYQADGGGPFQCYSDCTQDSQCPAGTLCSQNFPGMDHGACGPAQ